MGNFLQKIRVSLRWNTFCADAHYYFGRYGDGIYWVLTIAVFVKIMLSLSNQHPS